MDWTGTFCTRSMYRHQQSHSSALCYTQETNKSEGGRWWGRVSPTRPTVSCHTLHTGDKPEVGGREGAMMGEGCLLQGLQSVSTRYTQETNRKSEGGRWWGRVSPARPTVSLHTLHTGDKPEVRGREVVSTRPTVSHHTLHTSTLQVQAGLTHRASRAEDTPPPPHTHTHIYTHTKSKKKLSLFKFKTLPPLSLSLFKFKTNNNKTSARAPGWKTKPTINDWSIGKRSKEDEYPKAISALRLPVSHTKGDASRRNYCMGSWEREGWGWGGGGGGSGCTHVTN